MENLIKWRKIEVIPLVILGMVVLGETTFGRFEIEQAIWKNG